MLSIFPFQVCFVFFLLLGDCNGTSLPRKVFKVEHYTKDVFQQEKNCDFCHVILDDGIMDKVQKPEVGEQLWLDKFLLNPNKK